MKLYTSLWVTSMVLLMLDTRKGARASPPRVPPSRCYSCSVANGSSCDFPPMSEEQGTSPPEFSHGESVIVCPPEKSYCATIARSPDFLSTLSCAAGRRIIPTCTMTVEDDDVLQLNCTCDKDFCSKPFSELLRNNLIQMDTPGFKRALREEQNEFYANLKRKNNGKATTAAPDEEVKEPIAEALKQEATVPSDDEEDDGEGSGSYDETRMSRRPSNPAAPSSFLPAEENQASHLTNSLLITLLFLYACI